MVTLYECQTIYSLKDLFYLDEILNIKEEAEFIQMEEMKRKNNNG